MLTTDGGLIWFIKIATGLSSPSPDRPVARKVESRIWCLRQPANAVTHPIHPHSPHHLSTPATSLYRYRKQQIDVKETLLCTSQEQSKLHSTHGYRSPVHPCSILPSHLSTALLIIPGSFQYTVNPARNSSLPGVSRSDAPTMGSLLERFMPHWSIVVCRSALATIHDYWTIIGFSMNFWSLHQGCPRTLDRSYPGPCDAGFPEYQITFASPLKQTWILRRFCQPCKPGRRSREPASSSNNNVPRTARNFQVQVASSTLRMLLVETQEGV